MEQGRIHRCKCPRCQQQNSPTKVIHAQMNLLLSTLDERQRRLYVGLESTRMGHGGDRRLALITGMSVNTIAKGRRELDQDRPDNRIRKPGGGRPAVEKKHPDILPALEQLLQEYTAGDPCSNKKWQRQSLQHLKEQLHPKHSVSAPTVARLLGALDYSRKVNRKLLGKSHPQRDEQFRYIQSQKRLFLRRGWPVISVDAKKRELIGWFKNAGEVWCRDAYLVNAYDYPSLAEGVGIPYGLYDPARNEGFVTVGTSRNTAEFAVDAILWWWLTYGKRRYPGAPALLILADGGGSNSHRVRLWKYTLQHRLANPMSLQVTVCHYPTGASKWNPVEHRLFGPISTNWKGYPLFSYERMLSCIRGTTTEQGLKVRATINGRIYATKKKVADAQMLQVNLHKHKVFPNWNYTIKPCVAW